MSIGERYAMRISTRQWTLFRLLYSGDDDDDESTSYKQLRLERRRHPWALVHRLLMYPVWESETDYSFSLFSTRRQYILSYPILSSLCTQHTYRDSLLVLVFHHWHAQGARAVSVAAVCCLLLNSIYCFIAKCCIILIIKFNISVTLALCMTGITQYVCRAKLCILCSSSMCHQCFCPIARPIIFYCPTPF